MIDYFAYGSNLNKERLSRRVGVSSPPSFPALLTGFELVFNKKRKGGGVCANIMPKERGKVYGAVYSMPRSALEKLDVYEGFPSQYRREMIKVQALDRERVLSAITYIANDAYLVPPQQPEESYLNHLIKGIAMHGLPLDYREFLLSQSKKCWCQRADSVSS